MSNLVPGLRRWLALLRRTPLHPQWLLGPRSVPANLASASGTVLDIGAADRWIQAHLPPEVHYVALDYPSTGRDLYHARPDVFGDAARLPLLDESCDGVICLEVLEHVRDPAAVTREISRVLRPGARVWLSMPFLYPVHDAPFDFQRYTEHGLRRDLEAAGLTVLSLKKYGHALRVAGLLVVLAIAGGIAGRHGSFRWLLLPIGGLLILVINLLAWTAGLIWPDWNHIAAGYMIEAAKP